MLPILFNYFTFNFNMVFTRPKNDTLLRFVNLNNVRNYKNYSLNAYHLPL